MFRLIFIVIVLVCLPVSKGLSQSEKTLYFHLEKITVKEKVRADSAQVSKAHQTALMQFRMNGYSGIRLSDSLTKKNTTHYYFKANSRFRHIELKEIREKKAQRIAPSDYRLVVESLNNRIKQLENEGYPFAQIRIIDQIEKDDQLTLNYQIDSGTFFMVDKIHIKSKDPFHEKTILSLIGLKPGEPYDEQKIKNIARIFEDDKRYQLVRPTEVLFRQGTAEVYIYLNKKKSSNADGYVGFQQDRITERLVLNGFVNLQLLNALNRAENIHLNWKNNPDQTQQLKTLFEYPFLFGSPIGIGADIDLQKQDTSFVRSDLLFELVYRNPQFRVSAFNQIESSTTITSTPQPGFRNYSKNTIGLTLQYKPFLPQQLNFYHPMLTLSGGIFNYRADTTDNNNQTIANRKYLIRYAHQLDFLTYFHFDNVLQYQGLASSIGLSRNEFIYFGGLQSVRGFYELELAGKDIWMLRNELVFQPIQQLSIKALYDYSVFDNEIHNYTHSFGVGFGLQNQSSTLEIIIANGKLNDNPFLLSDTKVHIGFTSSF